jgi:glycerol uptake facilitator-like aquaporin
MKKAYLAELIGTYTLSLVVILNVASGSVYTPFLAALTVMIFVYTVGHISGTHINPAVTIALWYVKKIDSNDALAYIAAQCIGALCAMGTAWMLVPNLAAKLKPVQTLVLNKPIIGIAEGLGACMLLFGITAVVLGKVKQELSGIVIGGSLLVGLFIAGSASNAVLNPAVALALGSVNIMYVVGPIAGAAIGVRLYLLISPEEKRKKK